MRAHKEFSHSLAIERTTPCLFGLFSLVTLFAQALHPDGRVSVASAAWYEKRASTFSDILAEVRRQLWAPSTFYTSTADPDLLLVPCAQLDRLASAACA